jgi:hypothetical protein
MQAANDLVIRHPVMQDTGRCEFLKNQMAYKHFILNTLRLVNSFIVTRTMQRQINSNIYNTRGTISPLHISMVQCLMQDIIKLIDSITIDKH